ncbi:MAG: cytochrome c oxidase assembly protein [Nocardioidaceae bacterium]|nr:cytochrome c oxidase assembly protein [Nocardioidaceae bacterium]MCL2613987.1 cytochrome c oxidase assembly protein [Nocardioidaceae bacterium]
MGGMDMGGAGSLPELTWARFFSTWSVQPGWLVVVVLLTAGYLYAWMRAGSASSVRVWRVVSFLAGLAVMWVCVASAIGAYVMTLFWMHMVMHLTLIMVVPALLVLGHPITVLVESLPERPQERLRRALKRFPLSWIGSPAAGIAAYVLVIFYTHLTGFMDQMAVHSGLMTLEQVLYVVAGYLVFLPLIGEEPIGSEPSYLFRLILLFIMMVPDTVVGLVLLQTNHVLFPVWMRLRPHWAFDALHDQHTAGGLMWAAGDGLMMLIAVGLMVSVVTSPTRRERMTGTWMEGARRSTFITHIEQSGSGTEADVADFDPDSDEAMDAYNRMLARLRDHDER